MLGRFNSTYIFKIMPSEHDPTAEYIMITASGKIVDANRPFLLGKQYGMNLEEFTLQMKSDQLRFIPPPNHLDILESTRRLSDLESIAQRITRLSRFEESEFRKGVAQGYQNPVRKPKPEEYVPIYLRIRINPDSI